MEFQFQETGCEFLRGVVCEVLNEEQTQEVRLPEAMPDIGRVLAAWGQPMIRSKEWRSSGMGASGGVLAWVLYAPEDGSEPRSLEVWLPFQLRWDFPETQRDGIMRIDCQLAGMDARSVSARKLMVRSQISAWGEALEPARETVYQPPQLPEDIQLLEKTYPVTVPREAGEKTFALDEELSLPADWEQPEKLIRFSLRPELVDQKLMGDKAVFRGGALGHALLRCRDGQLRGWDFEVPFSQYAELEREYGAEGIVDVVPAVTNLEMELQENGTLRLKGGLVGQYLVYDRVPVRVVLDAYSPKRETKQEIAMLRLPALLDQKRELITAQIPMDPEMGDPVDLAAALSHPTLSREGDKIRMDLTGSIQILADTPEDTLRGTAKHWEDASQETAQKDVKLCAESRISGSPRAGGGELRWDVQLRTRFHTEANIPMVCALSAGEERAPDPQRPSLILRRAGDASLWDLAKHCGTTVEAIREANGLSDEILPDRMLLIPVP